MTSTSCRANASETRGDEHIWQATQRAGALVAAVVVAGFILVALASCGGPLSSGEKGLIKWGASAACVAAQMACAEYGGEQCSALTKMGCVIGGSALDRLLASGKPVTEAAIQTEVRRVYASSPLRVQYKAQHARKPGFRVPTCDSKPVDVR